MMQKRTLYISLLLVSCLLLFGFTYASAQTVTFQSKNAQRCASTVMNVTVANPGELSALELIFEVSGDYSSVNVDFASGFTGLANRVGPIVDGNVYRLAAMKSEDGTDACVDFTGGVVVAEITFETADVCDGIIDVVGSTVSGGCCDMVTASTGLVGCDPVAAIPTTVVAGSITIVNQAPTLACDGDKSVHWGEAVSAQMTFDDPDNCESLSFSVSGPGSIDGDGLWTWTPNGDDVCDHEVTITVTDKCGATAECTFNVCVWNIPPEIAADPDDTLFAVWGITLSDQVVATDDDGGPNLLNYTLVNFDGPTWYGTGFELDATTGEWSWDIGDDPEYLGDFTLCVKASDGANVCDPCSPSNSDEACYNIHVSGFAISIEKVHDQLQGHHAQVSVYLDSAYMPATFTTDLIGGYDFLIAYDASALTATEALPGELIDPDEDKFEYFTYRFGATGNCDGGCPSGLIRLFAIREQNNGVVNTYHITNPGELAVIDFLVTSDYNLECQYVPVKFFWLDCGDNTLSDESGNWLHLGLQVYDFLGNLITDPPAFGYTGPPAEECFDTVYASDETFKNAPIGSIIFRNGGVDIICKDDIDDRGDVNLNGIAYEIADAVVFTNYFIEGLNAFTINIEGQKAATEINGDGYALTVADLVYLVRVLVGDASPMPKVNPLAFADFDQTGSVLSVETNVDLGAALFVFNGNVTPELLVGDMELIYGYDGYTTRAFVWSRDGYSISSGPILRADGDLVSVETAEYNGTTIANTTAKIVPVAYELKQNYPNPFNPSTKIELALPVAAEWNIGIFNVSGQKVAEFSGQSEAGMVEVNWDASNMASGMYFYRATAGNFTDAKKMLLIK